jgi:hypothetical protein
MLMREDTDSWEDTEERGRKIVAARWPRIYDPEIIMVFQLKKIPTL